MWNLPTVRRCLALLLASLAGCPAGSPPPACDPQACGAKGQLCEADRCVDPWRFGSPVWPSCPGDPKATAETLAAKAAVYEARVRTLHLSPATPWVMDLVLQPGADPTLASTDYHRVAAWRSGENDGLWSALVLAAEAYRFAATRDPAARDTLAILLAGEKQRMRITGVPGLFTRQLIPPSVPGLDCPTDPARYLPSPDKRGNQWVRIGADGCAQVTDAAGAFSSTAHCGLGEFAGWCFLDNISQDEYSGHLFALGAIARLVDDPAIHADAVDLLRQIGTHLVDHQMEFTDWDGRPTQWGKVHPGAPGDTPGYLAVLGMSFLAVAANGSGDGALTDAYARLAAKNLAYLDQILIWSGPDGCTSNWNDISMLAAAFHHLLWNEHDAARRAALFTAQDRELLHPQNGRGALAEKNAWYDLMWAAQKPLGPGTDGPAYDAVNDAVCQLREFPASNHTVARDTAALAPGVCTGRQGESLAEKPFGVADRCAATFVWWGNPYERRACTTDPTMVQQPGGYLLPYWMGRYYGFIGPEL
jgi:hypothetical protein